jgi:hypothetical protein
MNYYLGAVIVVALAVAVALHQTCYLNSFLPESMRKAGCPTSSGFIGAMAHVPEMQNCLAYGNPYGRNPYFNRCTWC